MKDFKTAEQFVTPGLGIVILLSSFLLGVPLAYQALLALLGVAAVGTYFAPPTVQVETRIAIAAVGLVILLIVSSTAFWLALLSFGAIAALQLQHRHTLQRNPATITWLSALLKRAQARRSGRADDGDAEEETGVGAGDGGSGSRTPIGVGSLPGFVRLNVGGIGSSVLGVVVLVSVLALPWVGLLARGYGEWDSVTLTLSEADEAFREDLPHIGSLAVAMLALAAGSILSVVLPRIVVGLVAAAGLALNIATYFYIYQEVEGADLGIPGIEVLAVPSGGAIVAAICCIAMIVFQLIPRFNRSRGKETS